MDLTFTDEHELLRQTVRELCARSSSSDQVRALEDDPTGYSRELWEQLGKIDLLGLTIAETYGGAGQGALEAIVVYEEFGRALAWTPHLVSCVIAAAALAAGGTDAQRERWLPAIARGETIVTAAWLEPGGGCGPESVRTVADESGRLSGTKVVVAFGSSADAFLVTARDPDGVGLFMVPRADAQVTQQRTIAQDAVYEVVFDGAPAERLPGGWSAWEQAAIDAQIALAGYATGAAERTLEMAIGYAKERVQFGRPIGSFQGLAHPLADIATEVAGGKVLGYQAAWARANGVPAGPLAAMAKMYTADVFKRATKLGQQVFGGIGFTLEIDMQLYFRRAKQLELVWWEPRYLESVIATAELDGPEPFIGIR
jgi:alkylation response protein AidB-like acyl-CoA dehydrogenase